MPTKKKPGRKLKPGKPPATISKAQIDIACRYAEAGIPNTQIAKRLKISVTTLWRLAKRYPSLGKGLSNARLVQTANVETSLYKRATGYKVTREKPVVVAGELQIAKYKEHVAADVGAAQFWLTNRSDDWVHKRQLSVAVAVQRSFDDDQPALDNVVSEQ